MSDTTRKSSSRTARSDNRRFPRISFLCIASLLAFGIAGASATEAADIRSALVSSVGRAPQFAIADFDGDLRPDFATVRSELNNFGTTDYWIQLQLTATGRQSIRVVGPLGGLRIEARDVNGDHAVDLVLSTRWRKEPLAILLNDGHGNFLQADPASFPEAFSESETNLQSSANQKIDGVGVPPRSRSALCLKTRILAHLRQGADLILVLHAGFPLSSFVISHAGRAPPSEVHHN
jgi:hypothetical protein